MVRIPAAASRFPSLRIESVLFIALLANYLVPENLRSVLNVDGDAAYHIAIGRAILQHGIPDSDPLSFLPGTPFIVPGWASAAIFAIVHRAADLSALAIAAVALFAATMSGLFAQLRRSSRSGVEAIFLIAATVLILRSHLVVRPHLFGWI